MVLDPRDPSSKLRSARSTEGRGADLVIVAVSAPGIVEQAMRISRPGSRILLFAQTSNQERIEVSGADICVGSGRSAEPIVRRWIFRSKPPTWFSAETFRSMI